MRRADWPAALRLLEPVLAARPDDPEPLLLHAQCLLALGRIREAREVGLGLADRPATSHALDNALGALLTRCDAPARARRLFARAAGAAPQVGAYLYNLATAERMVGDLTAARASIDRALELEPENAAAHHLRSELVSYSTDDAHVRQMQELLRRGLKNPREEVALCFALGKALEDQEAFDASFAHYRRGNDLHRRLMRYDVDSDLETLAALARVHTPAVLVPDDGSRGGGRILVVGLPRSGTTLVERIIACHEEVTSIGESSIFPFEAARRVRERFGRDVDKSEFVRRSLELDPAALATAYLEATSPGESRQRILDKQPLNYLYLGLIRKTLPGARIIALERDPRDVCYSMYKTLFPQAYPFSYELTELARYYTAWHRLMLHWQHTLGEQLLIVCYEELVGDLEAVARRMLTHCGLRWSERCLEFHRNPEPSMTASAVQVRRPLYSSSVGTWRHVANHLQPLASLLDRNEPPRGWRFPPRP